MRTIIAFILLSLLLMHAYGCKKQTGLPPGEEIVSRYPGGEVLETTLFEGQEPNRIKIQSFEYYQTGERKKAFNYQDNLLFGEWTFWYKNGRKMGEGNITTKALTTDTASGNATYYWPEGSKMLEMVVKEGRLKKGTRIIYHDAGTVYAKKDPPAELKERIRSIFERWQKNEL